MQSMVSSKIDPSIENEPISLNSNEKSVSVFSNDSLNTKIVKSSVDEIHEEVEEYDTSTTLGQIKSREFVLEYMPKGTELFEHFDTLNTKQDKVAFPAYGQLITSVLDEAENIVAYTADTIHPSLGENLVMHMLEKGTNSLNLTQEMGQWSTERASYIRSVLDKYLFNFEYSINQLDCKELRCIGLLDLQHSKEAIGALTSAKAEMTSDKQIFWYYSFNKKEYYIQAHFY